MNKDIIKKIESRTKKTAGCWWWTGEHDKGKAKLSYKRTSIYPAVVMWEIYNKEKVPEGMVVKLSCENRSCVNPLHTYLSRKTYPWLQ